MHLNVLTWPISKSRFIAVAVGLLIVVVPIETDGSCFKEIKRLGDSKAIFGGDELDELTCKLVLKSLKVIESALMKGVERQFCLSCFSNKFNGGDSLETYPR